MDKETFIREFKNERQKLSTTILQLMTEHKLDLILDNGWTVKDVIAHINWYDEQMYSMISTMAMEGSELWNIELHERNKTIHNTYKEDPKEIILKNFGRLSIQLEKALNSLIDANYGDPSFFRSMPTEYEPWQILESNLHKHYRDHINNLNALLSLIDPS